MGCVPVKGKVYVANVPVDPSCSNVLFQSSLQLVSQVFQEQNAKHSDAKVKQQPVKASWSSDVLKELAALREDNRILKQHLEKRDKGPSRITENTRWKKGGMLGKGSSGSVYIGMNCDTIEFIAIKEVELPYDETTLRAHERLAMKEFEKEIAHLSQIQHPNIVRYLGKQERFEGTRSRSLYIFQEFVPGGSIQSLVEKFGDLDESVVVRFSKDILKGMSYLHEKNVIHRDIKGANVLVTCEGVAKLSDFGAAVSGVCDSNVDHMCYGTPNFMAPEVLQGGKHTKKSDIWSFGCVVLEMVTGFSPFEKDIQDLPKMGQVAFMLKSGVPKIPEHVSQLCCDFLIECLKLNSDERPPADKLLQHPWFKSQKAHGRCGSTASTTSSLPNSFAAKGGLEEIVQYMYDIGKDKGSTKDFEDSLATGFRSSSMKGSRFPALNKINSPSTSSFFKEMCNSPTADAKGFNYSDCDYGEVSHSSMSSALHATSFSYVTVEISVKWLQHVRKRSVEEVLQRAMRNQDDAESSC